MRVGASKPSTVPVALAPPLDPYRHVIVLPGGQINPDLLRVEKDAVQLVRDFVTKDKIVAAICHAPWLLIEAGVIKGRKATSYHSIRTDMP